MPGIGLEMEGAMQQAPQPGRQFMARIIRQWRHAGPRACVLLHDAEEAAA
jgi:hypothetical protein